MGGFVPGSFRVVTPPAPVWFWRNVGDPHESGLLVAWRQEVAPDRRTYWYGLIGTVDLRFDTVALTARWIMEAKICPVPNTQDDQRKAMERAFYERQAREKAQRRHGTASGSA